jgi:uncharacterized cofD-like protein
MKRVKDADARPYVVAIGGGHGLARSLGAARRFAGRIGAIVSVADDGGSSGRLREALGIPAPGDLRKSLGALLPGDSALGEALEYRFSGGELDGHAFGNLLIAALIGTTGDFLTAVREVSALLGIVGEVWPATTGPVVLHATTAGAELEGQVAIMETAGVMRVTLEPPDIGVPEEALRAIAEADEIVIGPGSLYTSVLAALAPAPITEALRQTKACKVYVANLREQVPETAGYDVGRHVASLLAHGVEPDVVLADTTSLLLGNVPSEITVLETSLARPGGTVHDEEKLAGALFELAEKSIAATGGCAPVVR